MIVFLTALVPALPSAAMDSMYVPTAQGKPFVQLNIFNQGEVFGSAKYDYSRGQASAWTLNQAERSALYNGIAYWGDILSPGITATQAVQVTLGTYLIENADASTLVAPDGGTELSYALLKGHQSADVALIRVGYMGGGPNTYDTRPIQVLPNNGEKAHLASIIAHEFAHALGVFSSRITGARSLTSFDKHLVDSSGKKAVQGQTVSMTPGGSDTFYVPQGGYAFFQGQTVLNVLDGAILGGAVGNPGNQEGIPINGWEYDDLGKLFPELSHLELDRSMMSHQRYRNYGGFMEAELAVLVDIGYDIKLKNYFGTSIYTSDQAKTITTGYSALDNNGVYIPGIYNDSPVAIGLHIYGDNNTVTQQGDILSSGFGSAGIRVDTNGNKGNKLTIAPGTKVHANGELGTGLMVAYGMGHQIVHRGDLQATGQQGVGARFDFGSHILGKLDEYRGSYIRIDNNKEKDLLGNQQGALVDSFDVSGSITAADKAIYISENAYVKQINIMQGAALQGDIISDWDTRNPLIHSGYKSDLYITDLTFGRRADADGKAQAGTADSLFALSYAGDIRSPYRSMDMTLTGGSLTYSGTIEVRNFLSKTQSLFTVSPYGKPVTIRADSVTFEPGSSLGVQPGGFVYNGADNSAVTVMQLASSQVDNQASVVDSSGKYSAGLWDYTYSSPHLDKNGNLLITVDNPVLNRPRAATSAVSAPTALLAQNSTAALLGLRMDEHFAAMGNTHDKRLSENKGLSAGNAASLTNPAGSDNDGIGRPDLWFSSSFSTSAHHGTGDYRVNAPSWGFGYTQWLGAHSYVGFAILGSYPRFRSTDADVDATIMAPSLYAGIRLPYQLDASAFVQYSASDSKQTRRVAGERYRSAYNGEAFSAGAQLSRVFELTSAFALRPFASYQYTHSRTDGYTEDSGFFALDVGSRTDALHFLRLGSSATYTFACGVSLAGQAYYAGLYGDTQGRVNMSFTQDPARNVHTSMGDELDQHSLGLGTWLSMPLGDRAKLAVSYDALIGKNTVSHQGELRLTYSF